MKVLIAGASGSGKSTIGNLLSNKGYETIEIDKGFADWVDKETGQKVKYNPEGGKAWLEKHDWKLNWAKLNKRLDNSSAPVFICGITSDTLENLHLFDKIFLLEFQNNEQIRERLLNRDHTFGKHPDEVGDVLGWYRYFQEQTKAKGAITVDCSLPPEKIVEIILGVLDK